MKKVEYLKKKKRKKKVIYEDGRPIAGNWRSKNNNTAKKKDNLIKRPDVTCIGSFNILNNLPTA